nr:BatD family protein [Ferruginibacter sp. HRS2-29]
MKLFLKKIIFTAFCYLSCFSALAQSRFYTTLSAQSTVKDEYVAFRIVIENAEKIAAIAPPSLKNFNVISGPLQETGSVDINGKVTQYVSFSYILQPKRLGSFTIGEASAVIDGKKVKSTPLTLQVGKDQETTTNTREVNFKDIVLYKNEAVADKVAKNLQLRLQTDRTTCYVGEPIVATYKLYTRLKNSSRLVKNPSFNGFSVVDMERPDNNFYSKESLGGRDFNMLVIRKAQLYPLQAGEIGLESAEVDNQIEFLRDQGSDKANAASALDLINGMMMDPSMVMQENATVSNKPITITVKPLPETGKPASFNGAVGIFHIECALAKNSFSTDETGTMAIRISGNGNLKMVTLPDIQWPDGIEPFEPKLTENISYQTVPISGEKIFTFSFSAQKEGTYTIPKIAFSYFDSHSATYKKDSTGPVTFTVTKGTGVQALPLVNEPKKEAPSFLNSIFSHRWWIIGFVALVIFFGLYYWLKSESKKEKLAEAKEREAAAKERAEIESVAEAIALNQKNPLEQAETCLYTENCQEFYVLLNREMKTFIAQKFHLETSQVTSKTLAAAMDSSGIANDTVLELQQLMQEIEWYLYTPFVENEKRNELYGRAHDVIERLRVEG